MQRLLLLSLSTLLCACPASTVKGTPGPSNQATGPIGPSNEPGPSTTPVTCPNFAPEVPYDDVDNDCNPATRDDDLDEDGFSQDADCNDLDVSVHDTILGYADRDQDTFFSTTAEEMCAATLPAAFSATPGNDCDDDTPLASPDQAELADDGLDNDCVGGDLTAADAAGVFVDATHASCSDNGDGSKDTPFCSLQPAVTAAAALPAVSGVHPVFVAAGTYVGGTLGLEITADIALFAGYDSTWSYSLSDMFSVLGEADTTPTSTTPTNTRVTMVGPNADLETAPVRVTLRGFTILAGVGSTTNTTMRAVSSTGKVSWTIADCDLQAGDAATWEVLMNARGGNGKLYRSKVRGGSSALVNTTRTVQSVGSLIVWNSEIDAASSGNSAGQRIAVGATGTLHMMSTRINAGTIGTCGDSVGIWASGQDVQDEVVLLNNYIANGSGTSSASALRMQRASGYVVNNALVCTSPIVHGENKGVYYLHDLAAPEDPHPVFDLLNNAFFCPTNATIVHIATEAAFNFKRYQVATVEAMNTCTETDCPVIVGANRASTTIPSSPRLQAMDECHSRGIDPVDYVSYGLANLDMDGAKRADGSWDCGPDEIAD